MIRVCSICWSVAIERLLGQWFYNRICTTASPVIVVGMHRSGTSLLVRLLERCGVLMGRRQTGNSESVFFQEINNSILEILGYGWRCLDLYPGTAELVNRYDWLVARIQRQLQSGLVSQHLGLGGVLSLMNDRQKIWGWKDPRNSLTLPLWYKVFPYATVIHIYRDGRDIALSLMAREARREGVQMATPDERAVQRFLADLKLWEVYIERIQEGMQLFKRNYTLKYEALLADPEVEMTKLVHAMDLPLQSAVKDVVSIVNPSPSQRHWQEKFSWIRNLDIDSSLLRKLGYN